MDVGKRAVARVGRIAVALLHSASIAAIAFPAPLQAATAASTAALPGFAEESATMGLVALNQVVVETAGVTSTGESVRVVTSAATAPPGDAATPLFFRRLSTIQLESAGAFTPVIDSEMRLAEENDHVTLDFIDRVRDMPDTEESRLPGLAGLEIRRHIDLDIRGFSTLVAALTQDGPLDHDQIPVLLGQLSASRDIELSNFHHSVTVLYPDGRERAFAAAEFNLRDLLAELSGGAVASGTTIYDCYAAIGVDLTIFGAGCLVAGVVVCGVACAVTAGVACIPCISGASLACGLGAAVGSLGYCLAKVLFGVDPPPTNTPVPTSTRTPTRTPTPAIPGDCDGDGHVTVGELILGVRIALEREAVSRCSSLDTDHDGRLSIGELIAGVRAALAAG